MNLKIALVFGGSRGIGAACVEALVADGFHVAYTRTAAASAAREHTRAYRCDIRDAAQVAQVFASVQADFGGMPRCIIANAGINVPPAPLAEFPLERFRDLVEVNILGAFNVLSQAAREVADDGSIIALTTSMVRHSVAGGGPYTATKAAVESLVRSLAKELAGRGVSVNCVAPGPIDTDLFRAGKNEAAVQRAAGMSPFNRVGVPEDVAAVVSFLASARASWVHGQVLQPNGGMV